MEKISEKVRELKEEELMVVKCFGLATIVGTIVCIIGVIIDAPWVTQIGLGLLVGSALSVVHPAAGILGWIAAWILVSLAKVPATPDPDDARNALGLIVLAMLIAGPLLCGFRWRLRRSREGEIEKTIRARRKARAEGYFD